MSDDDEVKLEGRGWRCFVSPWCICPIWFAFASVYMTHSQQSLHIEIDSLLPSSPQTRILYDHYAHSIPRPPAYHPPNV
jgi:hypothetical protein